MSCPTTRPTISMIANVNRYWTSLTANENRGGTKKKSKARTFAIAAKTAGPRPARGRRDHREQEHHHDVREVEVGPSGVARAVAAAVAPAAIAYPRHRTGGIRRARRRSAGGIARNQDDVEFAALARCSAAISRSQRPQRRTVRRPSQHDGREVVLARVADQAARDRGGGNRRGLCVERCREPQRVHDRGARDSGRRESRRLDVDRMPPRIERRGETGCVAHHGVVASLGPIADEDRGLRAPDVAADVVATVAAHLVVDTVGRAPQRELAQREQVALAEEVLRRALGLLGNVDLAFACSRTSRSSGGRSTSTTSSALSNTRSGSVS